MKNVCVNNKGFALAEGIIVIAVMTILGGIIGTSLTKYTDRASATVDAKNCEILRNGFVNYYNDKADKAESGSYVEISVYDNHMEIYHSKDEEFSKMLMNELDYETNYSGCLVRNESVATTDVVCKSVQASYTLRIDCIDGRFEYKVLLDGKLANDEELFKGLGEIIVVE